MERYAASVVFVIQLLQRLYPPNSISDFQVRVEVKFSEVFVFVAQQLQVFRIDS